MRDSYVFYMEKLQGEYREAFQKVQVFQSTFRIDEDILEERMADLLDLFLEAQEKGKPVEKITGGNLERFCNMFFRGAGVKSTLFSIVEGFRFLMWCFVFDMLLVLPDIWEALAEGRYMDAWKVRLDFSYMAVLVAFFLSCLISDAVGMLTRSVMFRVKKFSYRWYMVFEVGVLAAMWYILTCAFRLEDTWLGDASALGIGLFSIIFLVAYYTLTRERRRERRKHRFSFTEYVKEQAGDVDSLDNAMDRQFHKRFERKNRRLNKRGRPELEWAEFVEMVDREEGRLRRTNWICYNVIPYGTVVLVTLHMAVTHSYESVADVVLFFVILTVVETLVMIPFRKAGKVGAETRRAWIGAQRKKTGETEGEEGPKV